MKREIANIIISALQQNSAVERIAIKDNALDVKHEFTLEQYADEALQINADYVCFYLKIADADKANVKQTRFHFESSKRLVYNVQYREIVATDSAFKVKTSSIDYAVTTDYESAIQRAVDVHNAYVKAQREKAQKAEQKAKEKAQNSAQQTQKAEQQTAKQNSAKQTVKQAQNSKAQRVQIKSEAKHSKATVKRKAQQKAQ